MSVTTKSGDDGYTSLLNGKRVHKYDLRIELMGTMDELSSNLGLVKSEVKDEDIKSELHGIQKNISTIMAQVAYGNNDKYNLANEDLRVIEQFIEKYESMYISERAFIVPGNTKISSMMDVARAVARRVERQMLSVDRFYAVDENCKIYLNRISDYLYSIARYVDFEEEVRKKVRELLKEESNIMVDKVSLEDNKLNLKSAKMILEKVEQKANSMNLPVVIALANEWGNIIAVHFMDGALPASYSIAVDKAYTAATVRLSTGEIGELSQCGKPLFGIGNTNNNRIITFGGGFPLKVGDKVIGGIGVSGGSAEQDSEIAAYGAQIV